MRLTELAERRTVPVRIVHERDLPGEQSRCSDPDSAASVTLEDGAERTLLAVEGAGWRRKSAKCAPGPDIAKDKKARIRKNRIELAVALPANASREFIVKLLAGAFARRERQARARLRRAARRR